MARFKAFLTALGSMGWYFLTNCLSTDDHDTFGIVWLSRTTRLYLVGLATNIY